MFLATSLRQIDHLGSGLAAAVNTFGYLDRYHTLERGGNAFSEELLRWRSISAAKCYLSLRT
jgi:hypothetical protein